MRRLGATTMSFSILDQVEELHAALSMNGKSTKELFAIERLLCALKGGEMIEAERASCIRRLNRLRGDHKGDGSLLLATMDALGSVS